MKNVTMAGSHATRRDAGTRSRETYEKFANELIQDVRDRAGNAFPRRQLATFNTPWSRSSG